MNMAHPDERDDELDGSKNMDDSRESDQDGDNSTTDDDNRAIRSGSNPNIVNK